MRTATDRLPLSMTSSPSIPRLLPEPAARRILRAAETFTDSVAEIDRLLRRHGAAEPSLDALDAVVGAYWTMIAAIEAALPELPDAELEDTRRRFIAIAGPWLWRSRLFNRCFHKPHGFAGDYRVIEWLYDLETGVAADPTTPAIVSCLDHVMTTLNCTRSLWERRRWLEQRLVEEAARKPDLEVLDVACGGARYVHDFLEAATTCASAHVTLVDQDVSAIEFCRQRLAAHLSRVTLVSTPAKSLAALLDGRRFDVISSAGLFDYLDAASARALVGLLCAHLAPGGVLAITNFQADDSSKTALDWTADWRLVYRSKADLAALTPTGVACEIEQARSNALLFATWRKPAASPQA